jgi:hypothetical protein
VANADQTIQVAVNPATVIDGTQTAITVTGSSDTGGTVYASTDTVASGCGSNPSSDGGTMVMTGDGVGAPSYSDTGSASPAEGRYVVCAWLMPVGDDGSGTPLAGPVSTPLTVQRLQATVTLSAPVSVPYQQLIPVTIKWEADSGGSLLVNILPASYGPCSADPANEPQYVGWLTGQGGYTNTDGIGQTASSGTNQYQAGEFAPDTYRLCAWVEELSGRVVAGPVSVNVRMPALPGSRTYSGRSSQGLPVSVTVNGYTVQDIVYSARFACHAPEYFSTGLRWNGIWNDSVLTAANFGTLKLVNGRFKAKLDRNPANRIDLRGRVSGNVLTGSLQSLMRVGPPQFRRPDTCRTGRVRFSISTTEPRRSHRHRRR